MSAVDVSAGDAGGWMPAAIERPTGRAWQRFAATWRPGYRGAHELCSRACSAGGRGQPDACARNAIHRVPFQVL